MTERADKKIYQTLDVTHDSTEEMHDLERSRSLLDPTTHISAELDAGLLANPDKHPKAIFFILPNEFGERFCQFSIVSNINKYFMQNTGMTKLDAKVATTTFMMLLYFFPLLGAAVSDSFLGKWRTINSFSAVYLSGMIMLVVFTVPNLLGPVGTVSYFVSFLPMVMIALGAGGIKPCVSSHGGDQYLPTQEKAKDRFFSLFFMSIECGALLANIFVPLIADRPCLGQPTCYTYAFLLPTIVFAASCMIFVSGHRWYRVVPPAGEFVPWKAVKAAVLALHRHFRASPAERVAKGHWLNFAEAEYGGVFLDECRDFGLSLMLVLLPYSFYQMLFVQRTTEWATQYYQMSGALFGRDSKVLAAQFMNVGTILIVILIPLFSYVIYPFLERRGRQFPLAYRMATGYFCTIVAFAISTAISQPVEDAFIRAGRDITRMADYDGTYCQECLSGWIQLPQIFLIALGDSMTWPTGYQIMYVESGRHFRAVGSSFWLMTMTFGSVWVAILDPAMHRGGLSTTARGWIYCGIGLVAWIVTMILARRYVPRKEREPINQVARDAKAAEYCLANR